MYTFTIGRQQITLFENSVANKIWAKSRQKLPKIAANDPKVAQFLDEPTPGPCKSYSFVQQKSGR